MQWVPGLFRGVRRHERDADHLLEESCEWLGAAPLVYACIGMSWDELYL
jgi:hypothetical protein